MDDYVHIATVFALILVIGAGTSALALYLTVRRRRSRHRKLARSDRRINIAQS
jgi:hypothetical protein